MNIEEMRELTQDELNDKIKGFRAELFDVRFKLATHQITKSSEIPLLKHRIAQAKTILREKELAEELT
jgi:large subunit ribosomal protein L29